LEKLMKRGTFASDYEKPSKIQIQRNLIQT
jgi:hypothetical protein